MPYSLASPKVSYLPARPRSQWPVGIDLRFHPDAEVKAGYEWLRSTPLRVMSQLRLIEARNGSSWRQQVLALSCGRIGWARPDQLDLPLDGDGWQSLG
ncbi:hypothetical protein [Sinimarinibacterium sp. NLF-5-8]|uniref:hypothetical protein n=1 Tax=Sinimarinibacterium sp. NLF-5-8 TaxID=2698684 RepID=UPI00137BF2A3|nr:hypothetical protein [Sinimarinibacterium sp. NLF-5-8]QHS11137.1 hypothetical protein GT972_13965 [Sinimarinibacterium sp. NLF-5-8]